MAKAETAVETKLTPSNNSGGGICTLTKNQSQLLSGSERMSRVNSVGSWEGCQEKEEKGGRGERGWTGLLSHYVDGGAGCQGGGCRETPVPAARAGSEAAPWHRPYSSSRGFTAQGDSSWRAVESSERASSCEQGGEVASPVTRVCSRVSFLAGLCKSDCV